MELLFSYFFLEMHISCFFNFMLGNATIDQFPGREKSGKSGKFFAVTWISIWKLFNWGQMPVFADGKSFLDCMQMLVYSKNSNFGQFWPDLSQFWAIPGNFPGKQQNPAPSFPVSWFSTRKCATLLFALCQPPFYYYGLGLFFGFYGMKLFSINTIIIFISPN